MATLTTACDIIRANMRPMLSSQEDEIVAIMEEYAAQQVKEVKEERDKAVKLLEECRLQLEYLDKRFGTATTPNILSRVETFLNSLKQQP